MRAVIAVIMLCVVLMGIKAIRENVPLPDTGLPPDRPIAMPAQVRKEPTLDHDETAAVTYAKAATVAYEAERHCAALSRNDTGLILLRAKTGLKDSDDGWLATKFDVIKPEVEREVLSMGATIWCERIWPAFGEEGLGVVRVR